MDKKHNKLIGQHGEDLAVTFLSENGYQIVSRNFRTRYGEIDIIAIKDNILYCVEVKTRSSNAFGMPYEAINYKKLNRMTRTAEYYASAQNFKGEMKLLLIEVMNDKCTLLELE
jgi:putative endonuclease